LKERLMQRYQILGPGQIGAVPAQELPEQGCMVELTTVQAGAGAWWSLGFEAFGEETTLRDHLLLTLDHIFARHGIPCPLDAGDSYGYPRWLALLPLEGA
jgi:hypothetical protein